MTTPDRIIALATEMSLSIVNRPLQPALGAAIEFFSQPDIRWKFLPGNAGLVTETLTVLVGGETVPQPELVQTILSDFQHLPIQNFADGMHITEPQVIPSLPGVGVATIQFREQHDPVVLLWRDRNTAEGMLPRIE